MIVFSLFSPSLPFCLTFPLYLSQNSFSFTSISSSHLNDLILLLLFSLFFSYSFILLTGYLCNGISLLSAPHFFLFFLSYFEFISLFSSSFFFSLQKYLRNLKLKQQQQTPSAWSCSLSEVKTICFIHSYISTTKNNSGRSRLRNKISGKSIKVKCYFILEGKKCHFGPSF